MAPSTALAVPFQLADKLIALRADATAAAIALRDRGNDGVDWIIGIKAVHDNTSVHADHWERHPRGDEVLCLLEGRLVVTLSNADATEQCITLTAGNALTVPRGTWHRLHVEQAGRLMFVTPSVGSEHRHVDASSPSKEQA